MFVVTIPILLTCCVKNCTVCKYLQELLSHSVDSGGYSPAAGVGGGDQGVFRGEMEYRDAEKY